jgi:hypothetical protein
LRDATGVSVSLPADQFRVKPEVVTEVDAENDPAVGDVLSWVYVTSEVHDEAFPAASVAIP